MNKTLYQFLAVMPNAPREDIVLAIERAKRHGQLNPKVLAAAEEHLLDTHKRSIYDGYLLETLQNPNQVVHPKIDTTIQPVEPPPLRANKQPRRTAATVTRTAVPIATPTRPTSARSDAPATPTSHTSPAGVNKPNPAAYQTRQAFGAVIHTPSKSKAKRMAATEAGQNAALLAFFLGTFGAQHFYRQEIFKGILCLFFAWSLIPLVLGIIEGCLYFIRHEPKQVA